MAQHIRYSGLTCSFEDCGRRAITKKRGLCEAHNGQSARGETLRPVRDTRKGRLTVSWVESFTESTDGGCAVWTRPTTSHGYAAAREDGSLIYLHRFMWESEHGAVPRGKVVDHMCGNRRCLNIEHLNVVSDKQNKQHMAHLHPRNKTGFRGVYMRPDGRYVAQCRVEGAAMYIGSFDTAEEADAAARNARIKAGYYEPSV